MTEKEKLLEYIDKPVLTDARNSMGCSENWYNPYYAMKETFTKEEIENMSDKEINNLIKLAENIMDAIWTELYNAAKEVQNPRQISDYVSGGEVAAAILSKSGKIYTGVCIDTCSTLGICAERNAIFNMITNGENEFTKVVAVMPDGKCGAPCGACRELMVQLMPKTYKGIEILMDYENERIIKLGDITPEWWIGE